MDQDRTTSPGRLTLMSVQHHEEQVDYSYDQWRRAQMRQRERSDAGITDTLRKPAAA